MYVIGDKSIPVLKGFMARALQIHFVTLKLLGFLFLSTLRLGVNLPNLINEKF